MDLLRAKKKQKNEDYWCDHQSQNSQPQDSYNTTACTHQSSISLTKNLVTQNNAGVVTFLFLPNNQSNVLVTWQDMNMTVSLLSWVEMLAQWVSLSTNTEHTLFLVKRNIIKLLAIKVCGLLSHYFCKEACFLIVDKKKVRKHNLCSWIKSTINAPITRHRCSHHRKYSFLKMSCTFLFNFYIIK